MARRGDPRPRPGEEAAKNLTWAAKQARHQAGVNRATSERNAKNLAVTARQNVHQAGVNRATSERNARDLGITARQVRHQAGVNRATNQREGARMLTSRAKQQRGQPFSLRGAASRRLGRSR